MQTTKEPDALVRNLKHVLEIHPDQQSSPGEGLKPGAKNKHFFNTQEGFPRRQKTGQGS